MPSVVLRALFFIAGWTMANFAYQGLRGLFGKPYSWSKAFKRSYFQAVAVLIFAILLAVLPQ